MMERMRCIVVFNDCMTNSKRETTHIHMFNLLVRTEKKEGAAFRTKIFTRN